MEIRMKGIIFATLVAAAIGLAMPTSGAIAAPVSGVAIGEAANLDNVVEQVQHSRWRSRRAHMRWRSRGWGHFRGRSRGPSRCHTRSWSRWRPC